MAQSEKVRCGWCGTDPLYVGYHDREWGVPVHDDRKLFEFLVLEGAQAGLSWITILRKRDAYRRAFDDFDVEKVARYSAKKIQALLGDPKILVAVVSWVLYSFATFARRTIGWSGRRAAWLSALAFVVILLNFVPVGYFLTKSHNF